MRIGCDHGQVIIHDLRSNTPSRVFNLNTIINNNNNNNNINNNNNSSSKRGICCLSTINNNNIISSCSSYDYIYNGGNGNIDSSSNKLIAGCTNGYVTVFEPFHQLIYTNNKLHSDDIRSVHILPSSSSSSSSSHHHHNQYHDNNIISSPRFNQHESYQLLTSSYDGTAMIWNMLTNQQANEYKFYGKPKILKGHSDKVLQAIPVFRSQSSSSRSSSGRTNGGRGVDVITTAADGKVLLWTTGAS